MYKKITTVAEVANLKEGDTITQFPCNSEDGPLDVFDEARKANIGSFEIRTISKQYGVLTLTESKFRTRLYAAPMEARRLSIKGSDIIAEKVWWVQP